MNLPRTALVDVDGVLTNFVTEVLKLQEYGDLTADECTQWDFFKLLDPRDKYRIDTMLNSSRFWRHRLQPRDDARKFGDLLRELGYDRIEIVTAPWSLAVVSARADWLQEYFPGQYDAVHFTKNKGTVYGNLLIDDAIHNLDAAQMGVNSSVTTVLMTAAYNKDETRFKRIGKWSELKSALRLSNK